MTLSFRSLLIKTCEQLIHYWQHRNGSMLHARGVLTLSAAVLLTVGGIGHSTAHACEFAGSQRITYKVRSTLSNC